MVTPKKRTGESAHGEDWWLMVWKKKGLLLNTMDMLSQPGTFLKTALVGRATTRKGDFGEKGPAESIFIRVRAFHTRAASVISHNNIQGKLLFKKFAQTSQ